MFREILLPKKVSTKSLYSAPYVSAGRKESEPNYYYYLHSIDCMSFYLLIEMFQNAFCAHLYQL
jgi:hypothetical protein